MVSLDILHKRHDRHTGLQSLGERRHEQSCRGAVLRGHDTDFSGDTGISVSHRPAHVLLTVRDLANADRFRCEDDRRGQALPEDEFDAVAAKNVGYTLRNGYIWILLRHFARSFSGPILASRNSSNALRIRSMSLWTIGVERQAAAP